MTLQRLSLIFGGDYDRTRHLQDPEVREGSGLDIELDLRSTPHEVFRTLAKTDEGDGGELSLSFYTTMVSQKGQDSGFVGLPVPVSRFFRHGNILVNTEAGIEGPADLEGKVFGVPEYGSTMVVWMRGILLDEYGIRAEKMTWRTSRDPVALGDELLRYPPGVDIQRASTPNLVEALAAGEVDACIGLVPETLPPGVQRLFPDYGAAEREYYARTQIFPIMHVLVLRRSVYDRDPALARRLFDACLKAKQKSISLLSRSGVLSVTLPWLLSTVEEQTRAMGGDLWPYGLEANRSTVEKFVEYSDQQGLLWNQVSPEDLFLPFDAR